MPTNTQQQGYSCSSVYRPIFSDKDPAKCPALTHRSSSSSRLQLAYGTVWAPLVLTMIAEGLACRAAGESPRQGIFSRSEISSPTDKRVCDFRNPWSEIYPLEGLHLVGFHYFSRCFLKLSLEQFPQKCFSRIQQKFGNLIRLCRCCLLYWLLGRSCAIHW